MARVTITTNDGLTFQLSEESYDTTIALWKLDPREGLVMAVFVLMVIGGLAMFSPIAAIVGTILALIVAVFMQLIPFVALELFGIIAFGIIVITIMMKRVQR